MVAIDFAQIQLKDEKEEELKLACKRVYDPNCGRYIVAGRNISRGEVVLEGVAYGVSLYPKCRATVCSTCMRPFRTEKEARSSSVRSKDSHAFSEGTNLGCHICKEVWYCSRQCKENKDPSIVHLETECKAFLKLYGGKQKLEHDEIGELKLLIRILCRRYDETQRKISGLAVNSQTNFEQVSDLVSNRESIREKDPKRFEKFLEIKRQAERLLHPSIFEGLSENDVLDICCVIACNSFGVWNKKLESSRGLGLYPNSSFFNHSCRPNCVRYQDGITLKIRALEDIKEGTELSITYIELDVGADERRDTLEHHYFFRCICQRCNTDDDQPLPFFCPTKGCAGFLGPVREDDSIKRVCNGCGLTKEISE